MGAGWLCTRGGGLSGRMHGEGADDPELCVCVYRMLKGAWQNAEVFRGSSSEPHCSGVGGG